MRKAIKVLLGLILIPVLLDTWLFYFQIPWWDPMWETTSPNGRFTLSVYGNTGIGLLRKPWGLDGTLVLRDARTGKVLKRGTIDAVDYGQPGVTWSLNGTQVIIVSIGAWDLPPEEPIK